MIKALWFIFKLAAFVAFSIWLVSQDGGVVIEWADYTFTIQLGFFLFILVLLLLLAMLLFRVLHGIVSLPKKAADSRRKALRKKGEKALLRGFVAGAAGDARSAAKNAAEARKLVEGDDGLILLLEAQAAKLNKDGAATEKALQGLMRHEELAFLGLRGQINQTAAHGDTARALELTKEAQKRHPRQPWILKTLYQLQINARNWAAAQETLKKAVKAGAIDPKEADSDRAAMFTFMAERALQDGRDQEAEKKLKAAVKIDAGFAPAVTAYAHLHLMHKRRGAAVKLVEKAWALNPHPELADVWGLLIPEKKSKDPSVRLKWFERLRDIRPDNPESQLALARAAIDERLWGEARAALDKAEAIHPSARVYHMRAEIEEQSARNTEEAMLWRARAADAPPERVWTCAATGRIYQSWSAIAEPHGSFNTIKWSYPGEFGPVSASPLGRETGAEWLIG